jgi:4-hydroxyproline epimerase
MTADRFHTFQCIDGHTCGNPVRLVSGGGPLLRGATMSERRQDFITNHDWVRRALMFEPRGHDVMSGSILYPPTRDDCDVGILFIEVSGALPMCGLSKAGSCSTPPRDGLSQSIGAMAASSKACVSTTCRPTSRRKAW